VPRRQAAERPVQIDQFGREFPQPDRLEPDRGLFRGCSLEPLPPSGVVHEDLAHGAGCGGEEIGATAAGHLGAVDQPQVDLVHERGGHQGVSGALLAEPAVGHRAQVVVDEGPEPVYRVDPVRFRNSQDLRDLSGAVPSRLHALSP
jgi:hypothetical protein